MFEVAAVSIDKLAEEDAVGIPIANELVSVEMDSMEVFVGTKLVKLSVDATKLDLGDTKEEELIA